jgi:DNA mismatch repair protein MLH3
MGIGAIMFEDRLDKDQCARLVDRLSHTTFPFMCAHGRPSMVPLVIMGRGREAGQRKVDWAAWKRTHAMENTIGQHGRSGEARG